MKKAKSKWTSLLMALCCVFACLGVGVAIANPQKTTVKAAANNATIYQLTVTNSHSKLIEAYPSIQSQKPSIGVGEWNEKYTFVEGTGAGVMVNDTKLTESEYSIKKPNDFYIELVNAANEGDTVTFDGSFYNETFDLNIDFDCVKLTFNGTVWNTVDKTLQCHELKPVWPSTTATGDPKGANNSLYLGTKDGSKLPISSWDHKFVDKLGNGFLVDGESVSISKLLCPGDDDRAIFMEFPEVSANQVVTFGGTFYSETLHTELIIPTMEVKWNGSFWEQDVEYREINVGKLTFHPNSLGGAANLNTQLHLNPVDETVEIADCGWSAVFNHLDGVGLKVNGTPTSLICVKSPGFIFLEFGEVEKDAVVSISGTFACADKALKYVIEESKFVWNGTCWEAYVEYTTHEVGGLKYAGGYPSDATFIDFRRLDDEAFPTQSWDVAYTFVVGSGVAGSTTGFTDGEGNPVAVEEVKFHADMFVNFVDAPQENDVLVIKGTWYCPATATKYVISESKLIWIGDKFITEFDLVKLNAKNALDAHFTDTFVESDYYASDWAALLALVEEGKATIDGAQDSEAVELALADAKASLDEVLTKAETDAIIDSARNDAKAELDAYKNQADYKDAEWTAIQAIITDAKAEIDASQALADIASIVDGAKAEIDEVKTAVQVDAEALATAKESAKAEVRSYYNALDFNSYSDESNASISAYLTATNTAIENATTVAEVEKAVADFKANVEAVEKISSNKGESGGCSGSIGGVALFPMLALAFGMIIRKKRED